MHSAETDVAKPGTRRVYSNTASRCAAETVPRKSGIEFGRYLAEAVFAPLGMGDHELKGTAAAGYGATSTVADLAVFEVTCCDPRRSRRDARRGDEVQFPGLNGVFRGTACSGPTIGAWGSRSGTPSRRTGPAPG